MYIYASPGQGGSRRRKQKKVCMQHAFLQRPDIPVRLQNEVLLRLLPMDFCTAEDACIMPLKNKSLRFPVNRASQTFILSDAASGILRHFRAQLEHSSFSRQQRSFFRLTPCRKPSLFPYAAPPWIEHPVRGAEAFVERGNVHGQCSGRRSVPEGRTDGRREIRDKSTAGTGFRKR